MGATTTLPGGARHASVASTAAMPEANTRAVPPSSAPTASSNASQVGFVARA